jgi:hypothetical protein
MPAKVHPQGVCDKLPQPPQLNSLPLLHDQQIKPDVAFEMQGTGDYRSLAAMRF